MSGGELRRRQLLGLVPVAGLGAVLTACTGSTQAGSSASSTVTSTGARSSTATPSTAAVPTASSATATVRTGSSTTTSSAAPIFDKAALTAQFTQLAAELKLPGAAMLIRTPQGEVAVPYGVTAFRGKTPVTLDDHFRVGSNTKTWTGTVILQLVQEGKIAIEDPVSKYRPDVPNGKNITIEMLLTMRSGLVNYTETYELNKTLDDQPQKAWEPEDLVAMALPLPVYFAPGQGYHYSNTNTVLLGLIAEKLDGKQLPEIYRTRLFDKLGLRQTSFPATTDSSMPTPFAGGYMYTDNVLTLSTAKLPVDLLAQADAGTLAPNDQTQVNPSWAWCAGAGISTIRDLATWVEGMCTGKLLGAGLQRQRMASLRPLDPDDPQNGGGYGWAIARLGPRFFGHTGELPGYNSYMGYDPQTRTTMVAWADLAPLADGSAPAITIAKQLQQTMFPNG